jgi:hypothetical protein
VEFVAVVGITANVPAVAVATGVDVAGGTVVTFEARPPATLPAVEDVTADSRLDVPLIISGETGATACAGVIATADADAVAAAGAGPGVAIVGFNTGVAA